MKHLFYAVALLTLAVGLSSPNIARAEYWSDNDLLTYCRANDGTFEKGACMGYILGIADTLAAGGRIGNFRACITGGVSIGQLADTVTHFLTTSRDIKHGGASTLIASALSDAFPCK
jgi:Rap1a immunity proteins